MPHYAHATVIGHLGQDPELRYTQDHLGNQLPVVNCSVATPHKRQGKEITTWWRVSMFGKRAEIVAQYLRQGDPVLFSGEPVLSPWTDKDGNQRISLELLASDFAFVGTKDQQQAPRQQAPQQDYQAPPQTYKPQPSPAPFDDDVPF